MSHALSLTSCVDEADGAEGVHVREGYVEVLRADEVDERRVGDELCRVISTVYLVRKAL